MRLLQKPQQNVKLLIIKLFSACDSRMQCSSRPRGSCSAHVRKDEWWEYSRARHTVLFDGYGGDTGGSRSAHRVWGWNWKPHKAAAISPSLHPSPAVRGHFGKLKWKWIHNGHLALKSCGNSIGQAKKTALPHVCVFVCVFMNDSCCGATKKLTHDLRIIFIWRLEVVHIMFDRILTSKHSLTDKGNNYLSFMCLRFLFSPLLLLLNMFLC